MLERRSCGEFPDPSHGDEAIHYVKNTATDQRNIEIEYILIHAERVLNHLLTSHTVTMPDSVMIVYWRHPYLGV